MISEWEEGEPNNTLKTFWMGPFAIYPMSGKKTMSVDNIGVLIFNGHQLGRLKESSLITVSKNRFSGLKRPLEGGDEKDYPGVGPDKKMRTQYKKRIFDSTNIDEQVEFHSNKIIWLEEEMSVGTFVDSLERLFTPSCFCVLLFITGYITHTCQPIRTEKRQIRVRLHPARRLGGLGHAPMEI